MMLEGLEYHHNNFINIHSEIEPFSAGEVSGEDFWRLYNDKERPKKS